MEIDLMESISFFNHDFHHCSIINKFLIAQEIVKSKMINFYENHIIKMDLINAISENDDNKAMEILLAGDIDLNTQNYFGYTALHMACVNKNKNMVKFLLSHENVNTGIKTEYGEKPIDMAYRTGDVEIINILEECESKK